jgi:hypothetical protein
MRSIRGQLGFTLIEIAIMTVVVGLLLGGMLKSEQLITSGRVLHLISQQDKIKAAYLGFYDRFRALPGDYSQARANIAGITGCGGDGNGDGRIEDASATPPSEEHLLVWEHLSKSGFLDGSYTCNSTGSANTTPTNAFGMFLELAWDADYAAPGVTPSTARHNLKTGSQIPSNVLAEIDRKIDDGNAATGKFRFSKYDGGTGAPDPARCYSVAGSGEWKSVEPEANCGAASLL